MLTKIKTNQLLKFLNLKNQPIGYDGELIEFLDTTLLKTIKELDEKSFFKTENKEENFYRNLAITIINYDPQTYITLDLEDSSNVLTNGTFHLLAASYLNQSTVNVHIVENTAGKAYIKNKNFLTLEEFETIKPAIDENLIDNIENSLKIQKNFFQSIEKIQTEDDIINFYYSNIANKSLALKNSWSNSNIKREFIELFNATPEYIKNNPEFLKLLFVQNNILKEIFDDNTNINKLIDFENATVKKFFLENPQYQTELANAILTIKCEFEKEKKIDIERLYEIKNLQDKEEKIKKIENRPLPIVLSYENEILFSEHYRNQILNADKTPNIQLLLNSYYKYFPSQLREDEKIALKYVESTKSHYGLYYEIYSSFPKKLILDEKFLIKLTNQFSQAISLENILTFIKNNAKIDKDYCNFKLSKEYLLNTIDGITPDNFDYFMIKYPKTALDFEFILDKIKINPNIYKTDYIAKELSDFEKLKKIVNSLQEKRISPIIPFENISAHFSKNNLTEEDYIILSKLIISNSYFNKHINYFKEEGSEQLKFLIPEICFLQQIDHYSFPKEYSKILKSFKDPNDFLSFCKSTQEFIVKMGKDFSIPTKNAEFILNNIGENIKNNPDCLITLADTFNNYSLNFSHSPIPTLNKKLCLKLLANSQKLPPIIKHIPETMYFDKEFLLEFAKFTEKNPNILNEAPNEIQKFFKSKPQEKTNIEFLNQLFLHAKVESNLLKNKDIESNQVQKTSNGFKI